MKKNIIALTLLAALSGCSHEANQPDNTATQINTYSQAAIDSAVDTYTREFIKQQPALATTLNLSSEVAGDYQGTWPDYSTKGMLAMQNSMKASVASLKAFDLAALSQKNSLHLGVNREIAGYYQGDLGFPGGYIDTWGGHLPYVVSQISGPLIDIPAVLQDQHGISSKTDALNYLQRLSAFESLVKAVKSKVLDDAEKGVILPKALFPNTLNYLDNFVAPKAEEHGLVTHFAKKLDKLEQLSAAEKQALVKQAAETVATKVYPSYRDIRQTMVLLEQRAPGEDGIWAQPNGESFYQHEIRYLADSNLSADDIHQIGLDEVARITAEMDAILVSQGMKQGSVGERLVKLVDMPQFVYEDSDEGRAQLLADLSKEIDKVMAKAPQLFATMPTQEVIVKRVPVASQAGAPGGSYMPPALDGSRPGVYNINLKDMKAQPSFSLKTLTYHEAVPGHHFQISLNMAQKDIGIMRQNGQFNAFTEGWALYSELVAYEMGMYENDPWGNLGRLQAEVYRAARLVVDTGLHHKRWSRAQAISYFHNATGTAMSDVESAIDRYMAWPGQALGYKLGMLKIVELRDWAKAELKERFDIKAFHDLVLLPGARPLTLLEQDVKRWVKQQKV
ncbi:DUF885 domain-containing protein [Thalassomonas haliotis]|uniref:DUF885 domain-containing protein n=1 Tax=Thalassomonas haliotis TaxID=485448 RepID=A0ABY7V9Y8_9GAMM|nr:DUF885 domain-containing protein [Thalassomonas haliotis]WDE09728.1 DUF885 domain-containing protein [Thalassomonas haliotis]